LRHAVCELLLTRAAKVYVVESDGLRVTAWEAFEVSGYRGLEALGATLVNLSEAEQMEVEVPPAGRVLLPRSDADQPTCSSPCRYSRRTRSRASPALDQEPVGMRAAIRPHPAAPVPESDAGGVARHLQAAAMPSWTGVIAMEGRGPANGKPRRLDLLLASRDSVALDATAMRLVGLDPRQCRHLLLTAGKGLGHWQQEAIPVDGDWGRHATRFEPAILDKAIAAMDYMSRYRWFVKYMLEKNFVFYPVRALVQVLRKTGLVEGG
jgi:hypothetical protein